MYKEAFPKFGKRHLHTKGKWAVVRTKHRRDSLESEVATGICCCEELVARLEDTNGCSNYEEGMGWLCKAAEMWLRSSCAGKECTQIHFEV